MKKLLLSALVLTLAACNTTQGPPTTGKAAPKTEASGGVMSSLGALAGAATSGGSGSSNTDLKVGAGLDVLKAATISDAELKSVSLQMRARDDKKSKVPAGDKYAQRLARLTAKHVNEDGLTLNFAVYRSASINANASADGSVRVYTALMDKMTDQELLGVIGHEIGHVKNGHSMAGLRTAYLASAGRKAAASSSGVAGALADSDLGAIGEKLVNSQFSQSQETESDDYGLAFMKKHGYDPKAMESFLRKLAALGGAQTGLDQMMSSHPDSAKRADRMHDKLAMK
jgi:putative metalloprotease